MNETTNPLDLLVQEGQTFKRTASMEGLPPAIARASQGGIYRVAVEEANRTCTPESGWQRVDYDRTDPKEPLRTLTALRRVIRESFGKSEEAHLVATAKGMPAGVIAIHHKSLKRR